MKSFAIHRSDRLVGGTAPAGSSRPEWICHLAIFILLLLAVLWTEPATAQVPQFTDSVPRQWILGRTERFASTHTTSLSADYRLDDRWVNGLVRTFLLSTTTLVGDPVTKDQIDALVDLEYELPSSMRLFFVTEGTLTNDVKNGTTLVPGINNTAGAFMGIGGRAIDRQGNKIGLAFGGAYNRQLNIEDAGGAVYGEVDAALDMNDYQVEIEGRGRWYNIAPRHNSNGYIDLMAQREFDEGARGFVQLRYDLVNTDLYIKRPEEDVLLFGGLTYDGLQARGEYQTRLLTGLTYPIDDELSIDLSGSLANQTITQREVSEGLPPLPRDIDPFSFDRGDLAIGATLGMQWTPPRGLFSVRMEYLVTEEQNEVEPVTTVTAIELRRRREISALNDFISEQLLLSGQGEYRLTRRDTISMSATIGIYRYDTPSEANFFDKDEQTIQAELRYGRSFSPVLGFSIYGQAFLTHLVYLFGQNSNDNNWNRVFRIVPAVQYVLGDGFQNYFEAEIVANYTDYDFEGRTQNIRGRSFREMRLRDSLSIGLTNTLRLVTKGDLRISERGSFSWSQFAESLLERTRSEGLEAELITSAMQDMRFSIGGRLSRVKNFKMSLRNVMEPSSDRTSVGPTVSILLRLSENSLVELAGWWEHRFDNSLLLAKVPWLFLTAGMKL